MRTAIAIAILLTACSAPEHETVTRTYDFDEVPLEGDLVKPTPMALVGPAKGVSPAAILLENAEAAFDESDMASAKAFYVAVAEGPSEGLARYARYKLGWVHYNLGEFEKALETFVAIAGDRDDAGQPPPLAREGLKDTVLAFAEVGAPEHAPLFYKKIAGDGWRTYCDRLVSLYEAQGKLDAAKALSDLLD